MQNEISKYYTPELEEFHVGFEYEYKYKNQDWESTDFSNMGMDEMAGDYYEFDPENPDTECRVKYLDKEDLEGLGWTITEEETKPYGIYYKGSLEHNELWYAKIKYKIPYVCITNKRGGGYTKVYIKNISELQRLMRQLCINSKKLIYEKS